MGTINKRKKKTRGNGEGTIYYSNRNKTWVGQYTVNGKRNSMYKKKNESVTDFKKRFNKKICDINQGTYTDKSKETVMTILREHIENKHMDGTTSGRSYKRDLETLEQIEKTCKNFCNMEIQKVTLKHIETAKKEMRLYSNSVIDKIWRLLSKAFSIACSQSKKILIYNLMQDENLKKPISEKEYKKVMALTEEEFKRLNYVLDNQERNHKYRNIIKLQGILGMRIGEVLARTEDDFNEETKLFNVHNTLTVDQNYNTILGAHTKTYDKRKQKDSGQRCIPLDKPIFAEAIEIINEQRNKGISNKYNLLFWDYDKSDFITPSSVNSWLKRINEKYEISKDNISTHRLRHYALTHWNEKKIPIEVIQNLAGHTQGSDITRKTYIDITMDFINEELDKIA